MKYQALKQLKTKTKVLAITDNLADAVSVIKAQGARFEGLSYIGGFPTFKDEQNKIYSIQGLADIGVVCSLPTKEIESFTF